MEDRVSGFLKENKSFVSGQETSTDMLTPEEVLPVLNTNYIGREIIHVQSIDSTNNLAREKAQEGCSEGLVVIAEEQTAGRGRLGRNWCMPPASSIAFSLVLKPKIKPCEAAGITLVLGTALCRALRSTLSVNAGIKWPNDIILNHKKVCGILTELCAGMDTVNYIIAGVGINVNIEEFPEELKDIGTSLYLELGRHISRRDILVSVFLEFEKLYDVFKAEGIKSIIDEFKSYSVTLGSYVKVTTVNESMEGEAADITDDGLLVIKLKDGSRKVVISGDVSVRGINGYL